MLLSGQNPSWCGSALPPGVAVAMPRRTGALCIWAVPGSTFAQQNLTDQAPH